MVFSIVALDCFVFSIETVWVWKDHISHDVVIHEGKDRRSKLWTPKECSILRHMLKWQSLLSVRKQLLITAFADYFQKVIELSNPLLLVNVNCRSVRRAAEHHAKFEPHV